MRQALLTLLLFVAFDMAPTARSAEDPKRARNFVFPAVPLNETLRQLGREARINLVISDGVSGDLTFRLEDVTPLRAIEIICQSKGLFVRYVEGIYYINTPEDRRRDLSVLDHEAFPRALAAYKRRYFQALREEGFTKEQALAIVIADRPPIGELRVKETEP